MPESELVRELKERPAYGSAPVFIDVTVEAGIAHSHVQLSKSVADIRDSFSGSACVADFDLDGWVDLAFASGGGNPRFYGSKSWWDHHRNLVLYKNSQGRFVEQSQPLAGLVPGSTRAISCADINRDGLADILVSTDTHLHILKNLGRQSFELKKSFSITEAAWVNHITVADANGDGLVDLFLASTLLHDKNQKVLENLAGFTEQHMGQFEPQNFNGAANQLWLNQGDFEFDNVSASWNVGNHKERTHSILVWDANQDSMLEAMFFNLGKQPIRHLLNVENTGFVQSNNASLISNNNTYSGALAKQVFDAHTSLILSRGQGSGNLLYQSSDGETWSNDLAWEHGINANARLFQTHWSVTQADLNNDGYTDVAFASGSALADAFAKKMTGAQQNLCLYQAKNGAPSFHDFNCSATGLSSSRQVLHLDFNNDGRQDLLFVNNNDFPQLLQNVSTPGNWVSLDVTSLDKDLSLLVTAGEFQLRIGVNEYMSQKQGSDPRLHLGLGEVSVIRVALIDQDNQQMHTQELIPNHFYRFQENTWQHSEQGSSQVQTDAPLGLDTRIYAFLNNENESLNWQYLLPELRSLKDWERQAIEYLLDEFEDEKLLPLYQHLASSADEFLSVKALSAIDRLESELSGSFLLYRLEKADTDFCRVAKVYKRWFEEEEAVIRSKYRAIPVLISKLQDPSSAHKVCASQALAASEHLNAAPAILQRIASSDGQVRAEYVRALGLIRQTVAIPLLRQVLANDTHIDVLQQVVIALTRLNDQSLAELVERRLQADNWMPMLVALMLFEQAQDSVVIAREQLTAWRSGSHHRWQIDTLTPIQQKAYLVAFELGVVEQRPPEKWRQSGDASIRSKMFELSKMDNGQDVSESCHMLWTYPLTKAESDTLLSRLIPSNCLAKAMDTLPPQQIANLLPYLPVLSTHEKSRIALESVLRKPSMQDADANVSLSLLQESVLFENCQQQQRALDSPVVFPEWLSGLQPSIDVCILLAVSIQGSVDKTKNTLAQIMTGNETAQQNLFINILSSVYAEGMLAESQGQHISAALLTNRSLPEQVQLQWAIQTYAVDQYSASWLYNHVSQGKRDSLRFWLSSNGLATILKNDWYEPLLVNADVSLDERRLLEQLASYHAHQNDR